MLLDSNLLIYAAKPEYRHLLDFMQGQPISVSAISKVEVLGYPLLTNEERRCFEGFFREFVVLPISDEIIDAAIGLRQQRKMPLGDSIVAATALCHGLTLVTRNVQDFSGIEGLRLLNPVDR